MAVATKFGDVIDYLLAELPAALGEIQLTEADPGRSLKREAVMIGPVDMEQEWSHINAANRRRETVSLEMVVWVEKPGGTATETRERAVEIADMVADFLRSSTDAIQLGGLCGWCSFRPVKWNPLITDAGRAGVMECELGVFELRF